MGKGNLVFGKRALDSKTCDHKALSEQIKNFASWEKNLGELVDIAVDRILLDEADPRHIDKTEFFEHLSKDEQKLITDALLHRQIYKIATRLESKWKKAYEDFKEKIKEEDHPGKGTSFDSLKVSVPDFEPNNHNEILGTVKYDKHDGRIFTDVNQEANELLDKIQGIREVKRSLYIKDKKDVTKNSLEAQKVLYKGKLKAVKSTLNRTLSKPGKKSRIPGRSNQTIAKALGRKRSGLLGKFFELVASITGIATIGFGYKEAKRQSGRYRLFPSDGRVFAHSAQKVIEKRSSDDPPVIKQ